LGGAGLSSALNHNNAALVDGGIGKGDGAPSDPTAVLTGKQERERDRGRGNGEDKDGKKGGKNGGKKQKGGGD